MWDPGGLDLRTPRRKRRSRQLAAASGPAPDEAAGPDREGIPVA